MSRYGVLDVRWHDGRLIGQIAAKRSETMFEYAPEWLENGYDLSPISLPFKPGLQKKSDNWLFNLPGIIADSLPDSWGSAVLGCAFRLHKAGDTYPLRYLSWLGKRCMGALTYSPCISDDMKHFWDGVHVSKLANEARKITFGDSRLALRHILAAGCAAGGARAKAVVCRHPDGSLSYAGSEIPQEATSCIVKFDPSEDGSECATEHAYAQLAAAAGIKDGPRTLLIDDVQSSKRRHLLIERFDISNGRRVHVHTLAGMLERHPVNLDYADIAKTMIRIPMTERDREEGMRKIVRRALFNVLSANDDDHGKNHAFIFDEATKAWRLSPAYDLTFSPQGYVGFRGMSVLQNGRIPDKDCIARFANGVGIKSAEYLQICAEVRAGIERWRRIAVDSGLPADHAARVERIIEYRFRSVFAA